MPVDAIVNLGLPLALIVAAYFIGYALERRHFASIKAREKALSGFPVLTFETVPPDWRIASATLMTGSTVVSVDYFKRIIAGLRGLVGGRIKTYEPLLDRARREALLRMIETAKAQGYDAIVNARLETSRLASATRRGKGIAGVEMLAFGTAVTFD